jgi:hypothetical protein
MIRRWDAMAGKSAASLIMEGAMEVSIADAKKHLSELLRSVEDGAHIVIWKTADPLRN